MRRSRFKSRSAVVLAASAFALASSWTTRASAQACCAGAGALTPARLALHEDELVGLQLKGTDLYGGFNPSGHYVANAKGSAELDLEQDLLGAIRVFDRGQIAALVPLVETWRKDPGISQGGGGIGDAALSARWDFTLPGASLTIPGIAALASVTFPTGRPPESASPPLASNATGLGSFEGRVALAIEQTYGHVLINVTGQAALRSARSVDGHASHDGPELDVSGAFGVFDDAGGVLALTTAYAGHFSSSLDGATVPGSGRSFVRVGVAGGYAITDRWRMQGSVFGDPPIAHFGFNQPLGLGLAFSLLRTWS